MTMAVQTSAGAGRAPRRKGLEAVGPPTGTGRLESIGLGPFELQPEVAWVSYPGLPSHPSHELAKRYLTGGFGGIVTFGVKGGVDAGRRLIDNIKIFSLLANVGDAKSLIIHPASTTHSQLDPEEQVLTGVTEDLVRLSVGLEHVDDLIADLSQALEAATADASADGQLVGAAG